MNKKKNTEWIQIYFSTYVYNNFDSFAFQSNSAFVGSVEMSDKSSNNSICNSSTALIVFIDSIHSRAEPLILYYTFK